MKASDLPREQLVVSTEKRRLFYSLNRPARAFKCIHSEILAPNNVGPEIVRNSERLERPEIHCEVSESRKVVSSRYEWRKNRFCQLIFGHKKSLGTMVG